MIWIFGRDDRLSVICSNDHPQALPILSAVMHEVVNGDINLDFEVPQDHSSALKIEEGFSAAVMRENGKYELFIIAEIQQQKGSENTLVISCRHAIQELSGEVIMNQFHDRKSAAVVLPALLTGTRWTAGTIENTADHDLTVENQTVLEALKIFIERWAGEISFDFTISSAGIVNRKINFLQRIGQDAGRRFEWGRDLQSLRRIVNDEGIKTALIGIGKEAETEADLYFNAIDQYTGNINEMRLGLDSFDNALITNISKSAGVASATFSTEKAISGSSLKIVNEAATGYVFLGTSTVNYHQPLVIGQRYIFSIYLYCETDAVYTIRARMNDNTYPAFSTINHTGSTQWKRYSQEFTATKTTGVMSIWASTLQSTCYVDNAMLEAATVGQTQPTEWKPTGALAGGLITKPAAQYYVEDPAAKEKYGRILANGSRRNRIGFYVNNEITDPAELLSATWDALQAVKLPKVTYQVAVLDLAKVEGRTYKEVMLGDTVKIIDDELKLQIQARCLEVKNDLVQKENTELLLESFQDVLTAGGSISDPTVRMDAIEAALDAKLDRGEPIQTAWLESEMQLLTERIIAGGGTVTINDEYGILIEEDPIGKTGGALKLAGGTLALADVWNAGTGTYEWRTFGTGAGILADLIAAGKISFDNAQGGTLTLGGVNNVNGTLKVYGSQLDESGFPMETVFLSGDIGGFEKLSIGELTGSQNIVTFNHKGVVNYYVDHVAGSDLNIGTTSLLPFKTIQKAIDTIPFFNNEQIYIRVLGTDRTFIESVTISGICGAGRIGIGLGRRNVMKGHFLVRHCVNEVHIATEQGTTVSTAATSTERAQIQAQNNLVGSAVIYSFCNTLFNIYDLKLSGNAIATYGFNAYSGVTRLTYVEAYNCTGYAGIIQSAAQVDVANCAGLNPRGLRMAHGSIVGGSGTGFAVSVAGQEKVMDQGAYCSVVWTYNAGAATPVYPPVTISTYTNNDNGGWYSQGGWASLNAYQGKRSTDIPVWYGVWFFNRDFSALKNADTSNRPIQSVRLSIQRTNNTGDNTSRRPQTYYNAMTTKAASISALSGVNHNATGFLWGERKWITLPNTYGTAFQNGTAKAIWIYIGSDLNHYMKFETPATLEITHG